MKRKIAMISFTAFCAGLQRGEHAQENIYVAQVARHLAQAGYQIDIFTDTENKELSTLYQVNDNIHVVYIPADDSEEELPSSLQDVSVFMIEVFEKQEKPYDLIHANSWVSGLVAEGIKTALGTPFIVRLPALAEKANSPHSKLRFEMAGRILREADGIIAGCLEEGEELVSLYDADPAYIRQIPCEEQQGFSWQTVADLLADYYENVLSIRRVEILDINRFDLTTPEPDSRLARLEYTLETSIRSLQHTKETIGELTFQAANMILNCVQRGGRIMVAADDNSAAFAQYMAAELSARVPAPVMPLAVETMFLKAWSNTEGLESSFSGQVHALGRAGDLLIGISAGGRSTQLIEAFQSARENKIHRLGLMGNEAGDLLFLSELALVVPSANVQHIKQAQMLVLHAICELVEEHHMHASLPPESPYYVSPVMDSLQILAE